MFLNNRQTSRNPGEWQTKNAKDVRLLCSTSLYIRYRQTPYQIELEEYVTPRPVRIWWWRAAPCQNAAGNGHSSLIVHLIFVNWRFRYTERQANAFGVIRNSHRPLSDYAYLAHKSPIICKITKRNEEYPISRQLFLQPQSRFCDIEFRVSPSSSFDDAK